MAQAPEKSHDIPKINTNEINNVYKAMIASFNGAKRITPLWICAREKNFGFRPSLETNHLPQIMFDWIASMKLGLVVVVPLIFYSCEEKNIENAEDTQGKLFDPNFLVYNHYNVLISYIASDDSITIERYEPSSISQQGKLQEKLEDLFKNSFSNYTRRVVNFKLVAPKGLQAKYGDTRLCGHHIVYWTIYRLKYGLQASVDMLTDNVSIDRFDSFCKCMKDLGIAQCRANV
jgi:hypothetical protein